MPGKEDGLTAAMVRWTADTAWYPSRTPHEFHLQMQALNATLVALQQEIPHVTITVDEFTDNTVSLRVKAAEAYAAETRTFLGSRNVAVIAEHNTLRGVIEFKLLEMQLETPGIPLYGKI